MRFLLPDLGGLTMITTSFLRPVAGKRHSRSRNRSPRKPSRQAPTALDVFRYYSTKSARPTIIHPRRSFTPAARPSAYQLSARRPAAGRRGGRAHEKARRRSAGGRMSVCSCNMQYVCRKQYVCRSMYLIPYFSGARPRISLASAGVATSLPSILASSTTLATI